MNCFTRRENFVKKYVHKKNNRNKNIYSVSKQGSTKRKWHEFQLVLWKSSYVALAFCFPMPTYSPLRYLPSKKLFLSHTIPVLRCTDRDQNDLLLLPDYGRTGSLLCFLGYSTFNPNCFFTLFARLRSPCKLCLPSHTLTTVSMKRRRCISLTNYSHGKGLKPPNIVRFFLFRSGRSSFDQCTGREKNYWLRTIMSKRTTTLLRLFQVSVNTNLQNKI